MRAIDLFKEWLERNNRYEMESVRYENGDFITTQVMGGHLTICFLESDEYPPRWECINDVNINIYSNHGLFLLMMGNHVIYEEKEQYIFAEIEGDKFIIRDKRKGEKIIIKVR